MSFQDVADIVCIVGLSVAAIIMATGPYVFRDHKPAWVRVVWKMARIKD